MALTIGGARWSAVSRRGRRPFVAISDERITHVCEPRPRVVPSEQGGTVNSTIQVLGIAGSLREDSHNHALLRAAQELAGDSMSIEIADLDEVPPFNEDVEADGDPAPVAELKRRIREADA